mgnify:CR=1 FL=1
MKKLLGIVVLGLLLSGNAYAKIIILKKCSLGEEYEKWNYKINTISNEIIEVRILTEKYLERSKKEGKYDPKISVTNFFLTYYERPYAKGSRNFEIQGENRTSEIDINLNDKTIINTFTYGDGSKFSSTIRCK